MERWPTGLSMVFTIVTNASGEPYSAGNSGDDFDFAYTPGVYIQPDGHGRQSGATLAEASLAADIVIDSPAARPGIGFSSQDGKQSVHAYVVLQFRQQFHRGLAQIFRRPGAGHQAVFERHQPRRHSGRAIRPGKCTKIISSPNWTGRRVFRRRPDSVFER